MDLSIIRTWIKTSPKVLRFVDPLVSAKRLLFFRRDLGRDDVFSSLERVVVEDIVLRVDEFAGDFSLDCRSDLFKRLVRSGMYERELAAVCREHLDTARDVVDVGANIGFYTVLFGKIGKGTVLAIEPTPGALRRLKVNIERNSLCERTIVFEGVAGTDAGKTTISYIPGREEYSSIGKLIHPSRGKDEIQSIEVSSMSVDQLVVAHGLDPGFVKIDVEGMEHLVLRGMRDVLKTHRPVILCELSDVLLSSNGSSARQVMQMLKDVDYDLFDPRTGLELSSPLGYGDVLAIPGRR